MTLASSTPCSLLPLTLDVNDHIDPGSRDWATLDENGRIVQKAERKARSALLGLRFEAWLGEQPFNTEQRRRAGLIGIGSCLKMRATDTEVRNKRDRIPGLLNCPWYVSAKITGVQNHWMGIDGL